MKKIYFDLSNSIKPYEGISRYTYEITKRLYTNYNEYVYEGVCILGAKYINSDNSIEYPFTVHTIKKSLMRKYVILLGCKKSYSKEIKIMPNQGNIFVFWGNFIPFMKIEGTTITVIHDLNPLYFYSGFRLLKYKLGIKYTINNTDHFITVSEYSKKDISAKYGVPLNKIDVVYNGVDCDRFMMNISQERLQSVREKYNLPNKYFLYFGSTRKNKNIVSIIDAYSNLTAEEKNKCKFVCSNVDDYLLKYAKDKHVDKDIVFLNGVDEQDKVEIYKMAYFSIFISLCEGFGLPIIEAQAAGIPVITSNISCLPEIAGDAAILIDPLNIEQITSAIRTLEKDDFRRGDLIKKGYKNIERFSWDKSAELMHEILKKCDTDLL